MPQEQSTEPKVIQMYANGPYRLFSETRFLGATPYRDSVRQGYVGAFTCELCQQQAREVLVTRGQWICRTVWRQLSRGVIRAAAH